MNKTKDEYRSKKLADFIKEIKYKNRNPIDNSVLNLLEIFETNPELHLCPGKCLYRSRIIHKRDKIDSKSPFFGFNRENSFVPPLEFTKDMRANYKYIPYLYCATSPYLSVVEVRPRLGMKVSVATIMVKENLCLLDFSMQSPSEKNLDKTKTNLMGALSQLYSKPVIEDDDTVDYIPTQYIAEYVKNIGYDGIAFKSSLYDNKSELNIVVFEYNKCEAVESVVYTVNQNNYSCSLEHNDGNSNNFPITLEATRQTKNNQ